MLKNSTKKIVCLMAFICLAVFSCCAIMFSATKSKVFADSITVNNPVESKNLLNDCDFSAIENIQACSWHGGGLSIDGDTLISNATVTEAYIEPKAPISVAVGETYVLRFTYKVEGTGNFRMKIGYNNASGTSQNYDTSSLPSSTNYNNGVFTSVIETCDWTPAELQIICWEDVSSLTRITFAKGGSTTLYLKDVSLVKVASASEKNLFSGFRLGSTDGGASGNFRLICGAGTYQSANGGLPWNQNNPDGEYGVNGATLVSAKDDSNVYGGFGYSVKNTTGGEFVQFINSAYRPTLKAGTTYLVSFMYKLVGEGTFNFGPKYDIKGTSQISDVLTGWTNKTSACDWTFGCGTFTPSVDSKLIGIHFNARLAGSTTYIDNLQIREVVNHTVQFQKEDGTVIDTKNYSLTSSFVEPEVPEKTGYNGEWDYYLDWGTETQIVKPTYTAKKYTVKFVDYDDSELQVSEVEYGTLPVFNGDIPTRESSISTNYTFNGWDKEIVNVTDEATYKATYSETTRKYTIKFVDYDETELQVSDVEYGTLPVYDGEPTRESSESTVYKFNGWDNEIVEVNGEATYKATYSEETRKYTIKFVNYDDSELYVCEIEYGKTPIYVGETPLRDSSESVVYTFNGWDKEIVEVSGEATYKATYSEETRKYTIKFVNYDDSELQVSDVEYGTLPVYDGETPIKESTELNYYLFEGWDNEIVEVSEEATYKATYSEHLIGYEYTITFNSNGGSIVDTQIVEKDNKIIKPNDPTKESTNELEYTFEYWYLDNENEEFDFDTLITEDLQLNAKWSESARKYTIKFVNYDETELQVSEVEYGKLPIYSSSNPTRESSNSKVYIFNGWDPEIVEVSGEATYKAKYSESTRKYSVTVSFEGIKNLEDVTEEFVYGENVDFEKYAKEGYTFKVYDKNDNEITSLTVNSDASIKVVYSKEKKSGGVLNCSSSVTTTSILVTSIAMLLSLVVIVKRRKEN